MLQVLSQGGRHAKAEVLWCREVVRLRMAWLSSVLISCSLQFGGRRKKVCAEASKQGKRRPAIGAVLGIQGVGTLASEAHDVTQTCTLSGSFLTTWNRSEHRQLKHLHAML